MKSGKLTLAVLVGLYGGSANAVDLESASLKLSITTGPGTFSFQLIDKTSNNAVVLSQSSTLFGASSITGVSATSTGNDGQHDYINLTFTLAGGSSATGRFTLLSPQVVRVDLTGPANTTTIKQLLAIDYDVLGTLLDDVRRELQDGRLFSSLADSNRGLGFADDGSNVLIKYTWLGDANLDQRVDVLDIYQIAQHWRKAGTWPDRDFDYNGIINSSDLSLLARNWQVNGQLSEPLGLSAIPEPAAAAAVLAAGFVYIRRRHR